MKKIFPPFLFDSFQGSYKLTLNEVLYHVADEHTTGVIKITTRQTVLHPDLITACGDVNRNVVCSAHPKYSPVHEEVFEYAEKISEHLNIVNHEGALFSHIIQLLSHFITYFIQFIKFHVSLPPLFWHLAQRYTTKKLKHHRFPNLLTIS